MTGVKIETRRSVWTLSLLGSLLALIGPGSQAQAQSVELIPFVGSYLPLSSFGTSVQTSPPSTSSFKQTIGVLAGLRLRVPFNDHLAVEFGGSYVVTGWNQDFKPGAGSSALPLGFSQSGKMLVANGRITYRPARSNLYGILGAGYMSRGGDAWKDENFGPTTRFKKNNVEAIVGFGLRAAVWPKVGVDVSTELHLYSVNKVEAGFTFAGTYTSKKFQPDLIVTVGLPIGM